jgi:dipeptidyl aminopeptidase/acylaminoacyl peptidase
MGGALLRQRPFFLAGEINEITNCHPMIRLCGIAGAALTFVACTALARDLPVSSFARSPAMNYANLSPTGEWLSYVEESNGTQTVVLKHLRNGDTRRTLATKAARERVRWCGWDSAAALLCGTVVPRQAAHRVFEETRLYVVDPTSGAHRELNRKLRDPLRDRLVHLSPALAFRVLVEHDEGGSGYPALAELDLQSGQLSTLVKPRAPITRWLADAQHATFVGVGYERGKMSVWISNARDPEPRLLAAYDSSDSNALGPLALNSTGERLYALAANDGRIALYEVSLKDPGSKRLLHRDTLYDVVGPLVPEPLGESAEGVRYVRSGATTHYFNDAAAEVQSFLDSQLTERINTRLNRTLDGRLELIQSSSDVDPPTLYLLDAAARKLMQLGHQFPELENVQLASTRATKYRARDGQVIPAFLTVAEDLDLPLPAIVLPHGGPETRDALKFDPLVQFLASRGYAVLQMNFRGSTGYGMAFAAAGAAQWGGVIHNDITDGARWLIEQEIADPERICIIGSSFGGFAALLGAVRESQWYSCAASFGGISDLLALARATERLQYADVWRERLGVDDRALWNNSPLARAELVDMPVLLMHGTLDAVVPVRHSRRMARALAKRERHSTFIERRDCDHDMTIESCRSAWYAALRELLEEALR